MAEKLFFCQVIFFFVFFFFFFFIFFFFFSIKPRLSYLFTSPFCHIHS